MSRYMIILLVNFFLFFYQGSIAQKIKILESKKYAVLNMRGDSIEHSFQLVLIIPGNSDVFFLKRVEIGQYTCEKLKIGVLGRNFSENEFCKGDTIVLSFSIAVEPSKKFFYNKSRACVYYTFKKKERSVSISSFTNGKPVYRRD